MSNVKRIEFSTIIKAPVAVVWEMMLGEESFRRWTAVFTEGSHYKGEWSQGSRINFLAPSGDGLVAEIAENRPNEFISIRHLGVTVGGVEDTESESVRAWAPVYENYTFSSVPEGTQLVVDQDVTEDSEQCLKDTWQRALELLKQMCEDESA